MGVVTALARDLALGARTMHMDNRVKYSWSWLMVICNYAKCKFNGKGHGFVSFCFALLGFYCRLHCLQV